jgi:hypothetical protein
MAKLYAPQAYWLYSSDQLADLVNGCGPSGWKGEFVPDHLLWVSIKEACNIHDFMYLVGQTEADREEADRVFLNNMLRIVEEQSSCWLTRYARRKLALHYYSVVRDMGGTYFWADKNPDETFRDPKEVRNGPAIIGEAPDQDPSGDGVRGDLVSCGHDQSPYPG